MSWVGTALAAAGVLLIIAGSILIRRRNVRKTEIWAANLGVIRRKGEPISSLTHRVARRINIRGGRGDPW